MINLQVVKAGFIDALKALKPAISTEETRYCLSGVFFEKKGDEINLVATNGHQMIYINVLDNQYFSIIDSESFKAQDDFGFVIPRCAVEELLQPSRVKSDYLDIELTEKTATFIYDCGEATRIYKMVDGSFPEWRKVIPQNTKPLIAFNPKYLEQFCKMLKSDDVVTFCCTEGENFNSNPQIVETSKGAKLILMPTRV